MTPIGFTRHDHSDCVETSLAAAEAHCAARELQLTPGRRQVLEILLREHRALGAYDIVERMRADGHSPQPPTIYRALEFLGAQGFAHRIERRNAFVACICPGQPHDPMFLICRACDAVAEAQADPAAVDPIARDAGFEIERSSIELEGLCPACRETAA
ncbi:Fur family transcriptional regulator [uncultured Jannaschia sp.]|uniref:Fur family transcriptional regulator n=1 Tax=uncultured Jannaschia sp. TaxID=293347 RepID=UPI0026265E9A|nr:Fur family transcriptional regulator [uncultured Jannaschia sp.]